MPENLRKTVLGQEYSKYKSSLFGCISNPCMGKKLGIPNNGMSRATDQRIGIGPHNTLRADWYGQGTGL